jgi:hypothetical protein
MYNLFSIITALLSLCSTVLAVGFSCQFPWAIALAPWPDGRLSYIWIGSMFAAYALPLGWLAWTGERRAAAPGYWALALTGLGLSWHFNEVMLHRQLPHLGFYAVGALVFGLGCNGMALWAGVAAQSRSKSPIDWRQRLAFALGRDPSSLSAAFPPSGTGTAPHSPGWLRWWVFAPVVAVVGLGAVLLLVQHPRIFPWPLKPDTSVMFGILFAASGFYHAFPIFLTDWRHAKGQLLGFAGYNLVLLWPYFQHFQTVKPAHWASLTGFFCIIVATTLVAFYCLWRYRGR